jgi:diguanylate cyclase
MGLFRGLIEKNFSKSSTYEMGDALDQADFDSKHLEFLNLKKRVFEFSLAVGIGIFTLLMIGVIGSDSEMIQNMVFCFVPTIVVILINGRGYSKLAAILLLWGMTGAAIVSLIEYDGIHSAAIFSLTSILAIASVLVSGRHFSAILFSMICAVGWATWNSNVISGLTTGAPLSSDQTAYYVAIFTICSTMITMVARDLKTATRFVLFSIDEINDSKSAIYYHSMHDSLTGLANKVLSAKLSEDAFLKSKDSGLGVAILFVDIDNFKTVNDGLGENAGDDVLCFMAKALLKCVSDFDAVSRHSADQFVVTLGCVKDQEEPSLVAKLIMDAVAQPVVTRGVTVYLTCSIGISFHGTDGSDYEGLLHKAKIACDHAKEVGKNAFRYFSSDMNENMLEDLNISVGLTHAIERGEFFLNYQPSFDLENGELLGAEALIRWNHEEKGLIPPARFIPIAERSGLIVEIGNWVIDQACQQIKTWNSSGLTKIRVSINASTVQFKRGNLDQVVSNAIERYGIDPGCIEMEVTESALINNADNFVESLSKLKALGIKLAIDDFGTGYSNLSYIQKFDMDTLKIDQSFVKGIKDNTADLAIVKAIVQMAKSLNMSTTAEGIEDEETKEILISIGCKVGQGYFFGRPKNPDDFEFFARKTSGFDSLS